MGLLHSFTSFTSRHPFVSDGNASLTLLETELAELGMVPETVWFSVMRRVWDGIAFTLKPYWTRNFYVAPWSLEANQPSLILTCHVDSARSTPLGLSPTFAPGANDNAAGVVVLLEALRVLTKMPGSFGNWNILFAFLGGEEGNTTQHLWGSNQMVTVDLDNLGINPTTTLVLNIDEVGYAGQSNPTRLAMYHYPTENVNELRERLEASSQLLNIAVEDMASPRVATLTDVEDESAWSTSEWTFHTSGIPSLTLSTNQYPDPNKHTDNDLIDTCEPSNLSNVSKLVISTILSFAYQVPPSPPDFAEDWHSQFEGVASVTTIDYLDPNTSTYHVLILDPNLCVDDSVAITLVEHQVPLLALGQSGAKLLEILADVERTVVGTQSHFIEGFRALHPAIGSPYLLLGQAARPFRAYPTVYAVTRSEEMLSLVGNQTHCSMGYFSDPENAISILFIGIDVPQDTITETMATSSLEWLNEGRYEGILLGVGSSPPKVGDHTKIYVVMCDFLTLAGFPVELVHVNVTSQLTGSQITQLVTNESGVATLELVIRAPFNHSISAQGGSSYLAELVVAPEPMCKASLDREEVELAGEMLSTSGTITSSWTTPVIVNLSLGAAHLGVTSRSNLLLMPGLNFFHLDFGIPPTATPGNYSLILSVTTVELILLHEQYPLEVLSAYDFSVVTAPSTVLQQEIFEILINLTNKGSQPRAFDVVIEGDNFHGSGQVSVMAAETVATQVPVMYLPTTLADIGPRLLLVHIKLDDQTLWSAQTLIEVSYSPLNFTLTLLPPAFLCGLIILGICWQRRTKRRFIEGDTRGMREYSESPAVLHYPGAYTREKVLKSYPFSEHLERRIAQVSRRFGLSQRGQRRFSNDQAVLAYKRQGDKIHVVILGKDKRQLNNLIANLGESSRQRRKGG
jgi:hypothetical protein